MKKYFALILLAFMSVSCLNILDIAPEDQIASANMWTTESLADQGMAGLYHNFYKTDLSRNQLRYNDFDGINRFGWSGLEFQVDFNSTNYPLKPLSEATKDATEFLIWYEWKWAYTSVHQINDAIENLSKAPLSTEKYENYMCEAKFLRAWFYAWLNRIYQGVPLYLRVISEDECTQSQATSTEVWEAIISDLTDCIENEYMYENTLAATNYGRPSKGAAYSLRGEAYMWRAWEEGEDNTYYQLAANDFEKVAECGYGLWAGDYIDFFHYNNEKDHEMIFPLQFTEDAGFCDNLQLTMGGRDTWNSWSTVRPSSDFVDYYQNADGSKFEWTSRIPQWNDDVFLENTARREVFFLRNGIELNSDGSVNTNNWSNAEASTIKERIDRMGTDIFNKYYCKDENGNYIDNEDRVRSAYNDRDPRLKVTCLTPYDPYDTFKMTSDNGGKIQIGKELRWPFLNEGDDYGDYYSDGTFQSMYIYKKYSYPGPDDLIDRLRCPTDWPLIRYTNVYLHLAECYVHLGRLGEAISIVNEIRSRAKMPSVSVGSTEEVMEAVRYERRVELCIEGHDWFDEWRWGTYKEMKFQGNDVYGGQAWWKEWDGYNYRWYYTDDMFPWAAPSSECQRNPNLTRKAGWAY